MFAFCELLFYICWVKRIFSKKTIREYWEKNPEVRPYLETWYETVKDAKWNNPNDIKSFYSTISILKNSRVVFNIRGNKYRIVVKIEYKKQWLFIRFIGSHQEYDNINANTI